MRTPRDFSHSLKCLVFNSRTPNFIVDFPKYDFKIEKGKFSAKAPELKKAIVEHSWDRKIKDMDYMFHDQKAAKDNSEKILYQVYRVGQAWGGALKKREKFGLEWDITILMNGKVGDEYFKTKGHFHNPLNGIPPAEAYQVLEGEGKLLMQDQKNNVFICDVKEGETMFIEGNYAHGLMNTGGKPLVVVGCVPVEAGHAYGPIEDLGGFARLVTEKGIIPNPNYKQSAQGALKTGKLSKSTPSLVPLYDKSPEELRKMLVEWKKYPGAYKKQFG